MFKSAIAHSEDIIFYFDRLGNKYVAQEGSLAWRLHNPGLQQYWNDIGAKKVFEDPLYLDKLSPFLSPTALIIEYGCGYGRMMRILKSAGYHNLIGFDFAPKLM